MPLSQADTARLYSDAFATNMKTLSGEKDFVITDLKTQLDVQKMATGVLQDELDAANKDAATAKEESAAFKDLAISQFAKANNIEAGRVSLDSETRAFTVLD